MPPGPERDTLQGVADRFGQSDTAVEMGRLAGHVYNPDEGVPEGWSNVSRNPQQR